MRLALLLGVANLMVWALALLLFGQHPALIGACVLAYSLGLRHAVDADHIAAIDNVTRKLMQQDRSASRVGLFFALGHSTIVFALTALTALAASSGNALGQQLRALSSFGEGAGALISSLFLLAIAAFNLLVLLSVARTYARARRTGVAPEQAAALSPPRGLLRPLLRPLLRLVSRDWHMLLVGLLFGLGFDTATEISLLSLSAVAASDGLPLWSVMLFPALFAAAMALVDTIDSVLMVKAYGWSCADPLRKLRYNMAVTALSVVLALVIGAREAIGFITTHAQLAGYLMTALLGLAWLRVRRRTGPGR